MRGEWGGRSERDERRGGHLRHVEYWTGERHTPQTGAGMN